MQLVILLAAVLGMCLNSPASETRICSHTGVSCCAAGEAAPCESTCCGEEEQECCFLVEIPICATIASIVEVTPSELIGALEFAEGGAFSASEQGILYPVGIDPPPPTMAERLSRTMVRLI